MGRQLRTGSCSETSAVTVRFLVSVCFISVKIEFLECEPSPSQMMRMGDNTNNNTQSIADYLAQLLKDKKQLDAFPNVFVHMERLLDDEISKVRSNLFQINGYVKEPLILPEGSGPPVIHSEKVYVPVKEHPDVSIHHPSTFHILKVSSEAVITEYHFLNSFYKFISYIIVPH